MRELADYIQPEQTIDEKLQDLRQNKESMGIIKFDWELDCQDTFLNQFAFIMAPSKSASLSLSTSCDTRYFSPLTRFFL